MIYHYTYQTKNLINGKTYVGIHTTSNLDDGYIGSGTLLKKAIAKHGKENFKMEILDFFDTREEASVEEEFLINEDWVLSEDNYNLVGGGFNTKAFYGKLKKEHSERATANWRIEAEKMKKSVIVRDYETNDFINEIVGVRECARYFKTSYRAVQRVIRGERKHHKGMTFKYE